MLRRFIILALLIPLVIVSCGKMQISPTPSPTPERSDLLTIVPVPTFTPLPPSPTPLPSPTFTPYDPLEGVDPQGQEVTLWYTFTRLHEEAFLRMIEEFNEANRWGIRVEARHAGFSGEIGKKILAAIEDGNPPDVAFSYQNMIARYAREGAVVPLDDYIQSLHYGLTSEEIADYFTPFLRGDRYPAFGDRMLSFPPGRSLEVMYYNAEAIEKLGYENPPRTWEEFHQICKARMEKEGKPCYAAASSASTLTWMIWSWGGEVLSSEGEFLPDKEASIAALSFLRKLLDEGLAYRVEERYQDQRDFAAGKIIFTFGSTAGIPYYRNLIEGEGEARFRWSIAPPPSRSGEPVVDAYGPSLCVFRTTPERQLASWLFIKWFTEPEHNARWSAVTGYLPVRASSILSPLFDDQPLIKKAVEFIPYARSEPAVREWNMARGILYKTMDSVLSGEKTPEEAISWARKEFTRSR